jgi:hypothetical protein
MTSHGTIFSWFASDTWQASIGDHAILERDRHFPEPQTSILFARLRSEPRKSDGTGRPAGHLGPQSPSRVLRIGQFPAGHSARADGNQCIQFACLKGDDLQLAVDPIQIDEAAFLISETLTNLTSSWSHRHHCAFVQLP